MQPPVAGKRSHTHNTHGIERSDDYYWLRERESPDVIAYLERENAYTAQAMAHTSELQSQLYAEMKGRIKEDEASVPYRIDDYYYGYRYAAGQEQPLYIRRRADAGDEELILDVNELARGHSFTRVAGVRPSPDHQHIVYAIDTQGRRNYRLRFKNLADGSMLDDTIEGVEPGARWARDGQAVYYVVRDPQTLRPYQVYRHRLGEADDALIYQEDDETFGLYLSLAKSRDYVFIIAQSTLSTEYLLLDGRDPDATPQVFTPRSHGHEYFVDFDGESFYILTNHEAKNFRLMQGAHGETPEQWSEAVAHRPNVLLEDFELFEHHLVLAEREGGITQLQIIERATDQRHRLDFGEAAFTAEVSANYEYKTPWVRYDYESMTTPDSVYEYNMQTRERRLLKEQEVLGGFERGHYRTERITATAGDGARIPISIVYHRDTPLDGTSPLLLYGYGSYGISLDPSFNSDRLSLLDRGLVYAIAHIRGGSELGRQWYEDGKLFNKKNTFTDFIASSEHLIAEGYAAPERLYAMGGSAGGLLLGAVVNMRPDLYDGMVVGVPFVDVMTTMLDDSIPLTTGEYDEWGNPNDRDYFDYMFSYSPYDNVSAQDYPNLLITTGLHDSQVQYWEPAKWVARLRAVKSDDNRLLLHTDMDVGHSGAAGRYARLTEVALEYAFLLDLAGRM